MGQFPDIELTFLGTLMLRFSFFGACLGALMGVGQLFLPSKNERNYLLAFMFLCQAVLIGYGCLVLGGEIYKVPHLLHIELPFLFLLSPILFLLFSEVVDENFALKKSHALHLIPALVALAILSVYYIEPAAAKQERMLKVFRDFEISLPEYLFAAGLGLTVIYFALMIKKGFFIFNLKNLFSEISSLVTLTIVVFMGLITSITIYGLLQQNLTMLLISLSSFSFALTMAYLVGRRYPAFHQQFMRSAIKQKYQRSLLEGIDLEDLAQNLDRLMKEERLFENENITLNQVADEVDLTGHQLSQFLNEKLQKNFASYINEFRVEEAKKLLLDDPEASVLTIAYRVGFNSKSAFNRAFMKVCGLSPTQFRSST